MRLRAILPLGAASLVLLLGLQGVAFPPPESGEPFDLLIRGARVVDGSGGAWFRADVGVRGGRIARVGSLSGAKARRTVDAGDREAASERSAR